MKSLVLSILFILACFGAQSQTFEIRLQNAGGGTIAVQMRETSGNPPTTANTLTDIVFSICWPNSYGVSLGSITSSYTVAKAGAEVVSGSTRIQQFAKNPDPLPFPVDWVTNQWVTIMTIPNNLAGVGFGTFEICPLGAFPGLNTEINMNYDFNDFPPTNVGGAVGVQIGPFIPSDRITAAEYFFDTDPGVGNGTPIPVTLGDTVNISNLQLPQCLPPGVHRIYVRGRDVGGQWGFYAQSQFTVNPIIISGDLEFCSGSSTALTASGGVSYAWSNGTNVETTVINAGGIYTVTVTGQNGCTATASATVTQNATPVAAISGNLTICNGQSTTLTASGGGTYLWSTGATTESIVVPAFGFYDVTVTSAEGCTAMAGKRVDVNGLPTVSISGDLSYCAGSNTTLTASGGTSYSWSTGADTDAVTVVAGTYTVTATDANGCTNTASATVVENALPVVAISGALEFCPGGSTSLTASGGVSYLWNTGATFFFINVADAGLYSVTATDANGCTGTASVTVIENANVTVTIDGDLSICAGETTTLTATAGASYSWSTGASTQSINTGAAGTYSVTVTSAAGCTGTASVTVVVNALPDASISGSLTICADKTTTLTASGGTSYAWSTGANTAAISVGAGTYTVTATDANGCTDTASATVTANPLPTAGITGVLNFCPGLSTTLTGTGGTSYAWSTGANTTSISVNTAGIYTVTATNGNGCTNTASANVVENPGTSTFISGNLTICAGAGTTLTATGGIFYNWSTGSNNGSINTGTAGVYSVTVTNASGCTATASATVVVNPLPNAAINGDLIICSGETTTLTASGGTSYAWSTGANTAAINTGNAGAYTVTVTDGNGCTKTASATVVVNALPTAAISGLLEVCTGETTTLTASGGTSYAWSTGANTAAISVGSAGTYTVTVTDANGCTDTESVSVTESTTIVVNISGVLDICANETTTLTATAGLSYAWSTGGNTQSIVASTAGPYTVTVTNAAGCTGEASVNLIVRALPNAAISGDLAICGGEITTLTASGGASYSWSTGESTAAINTNATGTYTVTVTGANGCTNTASVNVVQNPVPTAAISGQLEICSTETTTLTASGGTSYAWSNGANTAAINTNTPGAYTVTVTDANGCTATTSATVSVKPGATAAISGTLVICADKTTTLTATGGISYEWSTGATVAAIIANIEGTYTVTATNAVGCTGTATATLVVNPLPTAAIVGVDIVCAGTTEQLTASGGTSYAWSTGGNTAAININAAGTYTVTVTDGNGCTDTESKSVAQPAAIVLGTSVTNILCNGSATGAVNLTISGGAPGSLDIEWSNGATSEDLNGIAAGTYTVTVTDTDGCSATTSATVTQPDALVLGLAVTNVDCNAGNTGAIDLTVNGGTGNKTYAWSSGPTSQDLVNIPVGTYTVVVTDANGCTSSATANIVVDLNDPRPLNIICPPAASIATLNANSSCQAFLGDYRAMVTITGGCSGMLDMVTQMPAPGAVVNPGTVGVKLSISNSTGELASCVVNVTVSGSCGN
ncbi:MAG: hypothetical protein IPM98_14135 [Lewinellaceae bacterium]|nr:hypothetical protein [Lewinellaceae bacterium]